MSPLYTQLVAGGGEMKGIGLNMTPATNLCRTSHTSLTTACTVFSRGVEHWNAYKEMVAKHHFVPQETGSDMLKKSTPSKIDASRNESLDVEETTSPEQGTLHVSPNVSNLPASALQMHIASPAAAEDATLNSSPVIIKSSPLDDMFSDSSAPEKGISVLQWLKRAVPLDRLISPTRPASGSALSSNTRRFSNSSSTIVDVTEYIVAKVATAEANGLRAEIQSMTAKNKKHEKTVVVMATANRALRKKLKSMKQQKQQGRKALSKIKAENESLQSGLQSAKEKSILSKKALEDITDEVETLQREIQATRSKHNAIPLDIVTDHANLESKVQQQDDKIYILSKLLRLQKKRTKASRENAGKPTMKDSTVLKLKTQVDSLQQSLDLALLQYNEAQTDIAIMDREFQNCFSKMMSFQTACEEMSPNRAAELDGHIRLKDQEIVSLQTNLVHCIEELERVNILRNNDARQHEILSQRLLDENHEASIKEQDVSRRNEDLTNLNEELRDLLNQRKARSSEIDRILDEEHRLVLRELREHKYEMNARKFQDEENAKRIDEIAKLKAQLIALELPNAQAEARAKQAEEKLSTEIAARAFDKETYQIDLEATLNMRENEVMPNYRRFLRDRVLDEKSKKIEDLTEMLKLLVVWVMRLSYHLNHHGVDPFKTIHKHVLQPLSKLTGLDESKLAVDYSAEDISHDFDETSDDEDDESDEECQEEAVIKDPDSRP